MRERYVVLGLAQPRVEWYRMVGQWSAAAMLPLEFVRCVSVGELRARLRSGRAFSAVLIDGRFPGLDRDLIAEAGEAGVAVLVVDAHGTRAWRELGAAAILAEVFSRDELVEVLQATATPIGAVDLDPLATSAAPPVARGGLIAVGGPGGTGASTLAIALAQGLAGGHGHLPRARRRRAGRPDETRSDETRSDQARPDETRSDQARPDQTRPDPTILLADLCRVADQALLHDSRVLVPSLQEVVEAHRTSRPPLEVVVDQTFEVPARGYRLLLGLRRPRHWVALRPRALESTLDALQALADVVVADVEVDVEGEAESGSTDVEDRNLLARASLARADLVLVVAEPSMKGLYALVRSIGDLQGFGVPLERLLPVINRGPRSARGRAALTSALARVAQASLGAGATALANPLHVPERAVDEALRDGVALPSAMARSLARAASALLDRTGERVTDDAPAWEPVAVAPGSLGGFTAQEGSGS
ncbi:MAG: hypothetical protein R6V28_16000 [Nitriliruptoraceae bacterium]